MGAEIDSHLWVKVSDKSRPYNDNYKILQKNIISRRLRHYILTDAIRNFSI